MSVIEHSDDDSTAARALRGMTEFVKRDPDAAAAQLLRQESELIVERLQLQGAVSRVAELEAEVETLRDRAQHLRRALDACQPRHNAGGQSA